MQTVNDCASDPAEVLNRLRSILNQNLRGQFVSAAYLWIDTEAGLARYSAAGHPPLICWRFLDDELYRIESNGLLFGMDVDSEYPVREIPLAAGDRFLLYTDGVPEPENEAGEQFGDSRLEQVMRDNCPRTVAELSKRLLAEIRVWKSQAITLHDDITLIAIDILDALPQLTTCRLRGCRGPSVSGLCGLVNSHLARPGLRVTLKSSLSRGPLRGIRIHCCRACGGTAACHGCLAR